MKQSTVKRLVLPGHEYAPGSRVKDKVEEIIPEITFTVHKFTNRPKPNQKNTLIFPIFSEFGSETLVPLYCLPKLLRHRCRGRYSIVVGWYGRAYLYKHLVDEFWEIKPEFQHLREYCRAFHHDSRNLKKLEKELKDYGKVVPLGDISNLAVYPRIDDCPARINQYKCKGEMIPQEDGQLCTKCGAKYPPIGLFDNVKENKKNAVWVPLPSPEKMELAKKYLPERAVGVVARGRKCYGRNLDESFYKRLIGLLEDLNYNPIWLGEAATTIPCPAPHIFDFSRTEDARDLELTLAITSQLQFTVQFWTASTRLAGLVGTPFLLFESPDQIWGQGQEGFRLNLCSQGPIKLVAAHYLNVVENQDTALEIIKRAILEMQINNYGIIIGQVNDEEEVKKQILENNRRVGF